MRSAPPEPLPTSGPIVITSVGRFFLGGHEKRHGELIDAFRLLHQRVAAAGPLELHLVGSVANQWGSRQYLAALKVRARGLPVHFHINASGAALTSHLHRTHIYWHGAGLHQSVRRHPERAEHFGIAIAEAMGQGAVPMIVPQGGAAEIVSSSDYGYSYETVDELADLSERHIDLLRTSRSAGLEWRRRVWTRAQIFSDEAFHRALEERLLHAGVVD